MRKTFEIQYQGKACEVNTLEVGGAEVYKIFLVDRVLILTRALRANNKTFWTSVPQGDQDLATRIGALIDAHQNNVLF